MAAAKPFKVGFIERPMDPAFLAAIENQPAIRLVPISRSLPDAQIAATFSQCQAYYIGATRGELPELWHVIGDFFVRCPGIMVVVSQAAGFDTVDVDV